LLGDANWWLPGWLDRLIPHLNVEGVERPGDRDVDDEPALVAP
jgi:RND superfamily putative drug exporter